MFVKKAYLCFVKLDMAIFFTPVAVAAIIVVLGAFLSSYFRRGAKEQIENKVVEAAQKEVERENSIMVEVEYKGYKIPMTLLERKNIWNNLTTRGKKEALAAWKKHLNNQSK